MASVWIVFATKRNEVVANCRIKGFKLAWHHIDTSMGINLSEKLFNLSNDTNEREDHFLFVFLLRKKNDFEVRFSWVHAFDNYVILFHFRFDEAIFANGPTYLAQQWRTITWEINYENELDFYLWNFEME